ncbi:MAG: helix-turn-helix domain-containing protein [Candidatus Parcubacteria bacterium]|nr:helix-turn-helix domain-containing protein [Candidatus Parcubacteria bacterium]
MARLKDREKALSLRKQGMSYSQIKQILGISKSTLSNWLKDYPLPEKRIKELRDWNQQRIERCRETKRKKREDRLKITYQKQKKRLFPLTVRELYLGGLFLYWGEGSKTNQWALSVSNSDPSIIKFFIKWVTNSLGVSKDKIKVYLQLYSNMNIEEEIKYWSRELQIPPRQFTRPYIKQSSSERINHKGSFGHGTCNARINDTRISEQVLMGIKNISDKYRRV